MQMTNPELADYLNGQLGLTASDAVTANIIRKWVDWDLLPKARIVGRHGRKGPVWSRSEITVRRALRLGELRKAGIRRQNALIVQAYIDWGHRDFDLVRDALANEWQKWAAQLTRRQTTFLDKQQFENISATKHRAIATQLGPLDARFIGTQFQQSPKLYATLAESARFGNEEQELPTNLILEAAQQILPQSSALVPSEILSMIAASMAGMTGSPDEISNSAASTIERASVRQFRIARHIVRQLRRATSVKNAPASNLAFADDARSLVQMISLLYPQISIGPWAIFGFVQTLKILENQSRN